MCKLQPEFSRTFSYSPHHQQRLHFIWVSFFCCSKGTITGTALDFITILYRQIKEHDMRAYMRGITALLPAKYKFKQICPTVGSCGKCTVAASTPKKQEGNASAEDGLVSNEKTDPIVAFSRPPPLPPVVGPLIALSLYETWSSHDGDDD